MRTGIFILLTVSLCAIVLTTGCTEGVSAPGNSGENLSNSSSVLVNNDPNTVPIGTAYNQTLYTFWSFTIDGPYAANANWTTAALDPEPSVIYDVNGKPLYYEFYLRNAGGIHSYFWTAANKRLGFPVFRIYPGAPSWNYSQIAQDAEKIVKTRYTVYPIQSNTPALYGGDFLTLCRMLIIRNLSSGASEQVNAFAIEIIPENASDTYKSHTYVSSYLDSVPRSEYSDRVRVWERYTSIANRIVEYAMAQGIDVRLPLSEQDSGIIRNYFAGESSNLSSPGPGTTTKVPDVHPVTAELIAENSVPVEIAREHALAVLRRIVLDRPDTFASRSWRNASISKKEPAIIEDFEGRNLYYVFRVERNGIPVSDIIVDGNKGLYSHRWGLETPTGEYDLVNATQKAREIAARDFPDDAVHSIRPVYSLAGNCCHNVTVMLDLENPQTREINRILVDTYTLASSSEVVNASGKTGSYPSLFSEVKPEDFADNAGRWGKNYEKIRNLTGFALKSGINSDLPLSATDVISLGTYIFTTEPQYVREGELYNPLYPQPEVRPTLDKATRVWHEQADWFSAILVDASLNKTEIEQIIKSHSIPGDYTVKVLSSGAMGADYYVDVPLADYNRTFSLLNNDRSADIREQVSSMWEYMQIVKRKNGSIIIPVAISYPEEANAQRLIAAGVPLKPMREVYIQYDYRAMPEKAEREKVLAELNADDRVLFAFKEYSG